MAAAAAVAVAAEGTSRRRILDYLNDGEEFGVEGPSSAAATPRALAAARSLLPRFRWARLARLGGKCGAGDGKGRPPKAVAEEEIVAPEEGVPRDDSGASASAACAAAAGGGGGGDMTRPSDLSVGLSLVFLLAKTSDEFNKMASVRAEMEALIRDFKGQQAITTNTAADDDVPGDRNLESAASSCLTDGNEPQAANARSEDHRHRHRHRHQIASSSGAEMEAASRRRMDVLEEEFHAELERVRASYGADTPPFSTGQERDEGGAEPSDDYDDDIADCRQGFESDLGDDDHHHDNNDEEADDEDDDADRYHGVSAVELERRLHELLHQRNQERIEELEAALRRAEKRLFEKEMEASLWKDTARMAFRHDHDDDHDDESP